MDKNKIPKPPNKPIKKYTKEELEVIRINLEESAARINTARQELLKPILEIEDAINKTEVGIPVRVFRSFGRDDVPLYLQYCKIPSKDTKETKWGLSVNENNVWQARIEDAPPYILIAIVSMIPGLIEKLVEETVRTTEEAKKAYEWLVPAVDKIQEDLDREEFSKKQYEQIQQNLKDNKDKKWEE